MRYRLEVRRVKLRSELESSSYINNQSNRITLDRVRFVASAGRPLLLSASGANSPKKKPPGIAMPCRCGHPKSIHARMYGNPNLGTPCNFPECRCKAYRPV
jgi:hypothetical protein